MKNTYLAAIRPILAASVLMAINLWSLPALADVKFQQWVSDFYGTAAQSGIKRTTYDEAFTGITHPDQEVLKKAADQPEFTTKIWDYLDTRVNPRTIGVGQQMASLHAQTLAGVERRFGVEQSILLAIWSIESNYGAIFNHPDRLHYVPLALATLAYGDKRRAKFARTQLIAVLRILQSGDISTGQLTGSWAGAMGHTQFIPTSYLAYAVDMDDNGRRDIWNSIPDALATAANLLRKNGWRTGKTWGYEAKAPSGGAQYKDQTKTLAQWTKLGFSRPNEKGFPRAEEKAILKMVAGANGPAFLMLRNFFILKRYNNSDAYALAVGLLADRLAGHKEMAQSWPRPDGALTIEEKFELQERLKTRGYYAGEIDGDLGSGSRKAIRDFQVQIGLTADGLPSQSVLKALRP